MQRYYSLVLQEIIAKDEELASARGSLKQANEDLGTRNREIELIKAEVDEMKRSRENLEKKMESSKASALQRLTNEMDERLDQTKDQHQRAMEDLRTEMNKDTEKKLEVANKEKEVRKMTNWWWQK